MNTSIGYHTFAFFQKVKWDEFSSLTQDFISYASKNKDMKRFPLKSRKGWEYIYENDKGIRWLLLSYKMKNGYILQGVLVIINPQALIRDNYITAANELDLEEVGRIYNMEAARISTILLEFGSCSLNRFDPCINIDLKELNFPCTPEQMMSLIKQGNIPKHYKERKSEYDTKQHRKITDKNSFYLESKSVVINYYLKHPKQNEQHPNFLFRESSRYVIRLEVQCHNNKLRMLQKNKIQESKYYVDDDELAIEEKYEKTINGIYNPSVPIDIMVSDDTSEDIVKDYVYKILRKGDYFTLAGASRIVESYNFRPEKEERILYALKMVSDCHGIAKAKSKMHGPDKDDFNRSLRDLDDMLVNPVTIPRRWDIEHIPNLLQAYYDAIYEEQIMFEQEYLARKHINEFLYKME